MGGWIRRRNRVGTSGSSRRGRTTSGHAMGAEARNRIRRESNGVGVGAIHARDHADSTETDVVAEVEHVDSVLDLLQHSSAVGLLLGVEGAREVEFVAADVVVPHEGTGGLVGLAATAVLVAAIFVAEVGGVEVGAEDGVENGAAIHPGRDRVVGREDVEAVAVRDGPVVAAGLRHGDVLVSWC